MPVDIAQDEAFWLSEEGARIIRHEQREHEDDTLLECCDCGCRYRVGVYWQGGCPDCGCDDSTVVIQQHTFRQNDTPRKPSRPRTPPMKANHDSHIVSRVGIALLLAILYKDDALKAAILKELGIDDKETPANEAKTEDAPA